MINTTIIGDKIAEARKKINMSQAQLAERMFISSQAVGKWERGESMPDIVTFNRLAEVLGVDLNYFSENFKSVAAVPENSQSLTVEQASKTEEKLNWDMSRGNWAGADFSGLKNLHEKFSSSNMQRCKFIGSDLAGLLLKNNNVDSCDFSGSDISKCQIQSSNLLSNKFFNCSLQETEFSGSNITSCDFTSANFTGVTFKSSRLWKNIMVNALWNRTSFKDTMLADVVFDGKLEDCYFENCSFMKVTFQNTTLINCFFKNKSLKRIRFIDCKADKMTYEFLKNGKADLTGITLIK